MTNPDPPTTRKPSLRHQIAEGDWIKFEVESRYPTGHFQRSVKIAEVVTVDREYRCVVTADFNVVGFGSILEVR